MITYKEAEFWMRVTLAVLALALFLTVHAIYWPAIVSLILTFILMPIRDGIIKVFLRLTGRKMPVSIAILISFVVFIFLVTVITNIIVKPLVVQTNLLAANFSNLVNRTADLVMQLENEQTQLYIPDQVKGSSTMPSPRSAITVSTALPISCSRSSSLPGRSSNSSSSPSLPSTS